MTKEDSAPVPPLKFRQSPRLGLVAGAMLALLAGCADPPETPMSIADEQRLFTDAYKDIIEYHLETIQAETLSLSGLRKLAALDSALSFQRSGSEIVVQRGTQTQRLEAPSAKDVSGWAALTVKAVQAAREFSPKIAAQPADRLDETMLDGALGALDPFSHYVRAEIARERRTSRNGYVGIGVTIALRDAGVVISTVLPDTPAAHAGLRQGDRLVTVNGINVTKPDLDETRDLLRGSVNSTVMLEILRDGRSEPLKILVSRARIVSNTASLRLDGGIAHLTLKSFNQRSGSSLSALLQDAHREAGSGLRGIVLDLRDNPGGLLDQSVRVASLFLSDVPISTTRGRVSQSFQDFSAPTDSKVEKLPLVVLVNGGSASSAEIVAAALQDDGRAVIVGTSSYGKGTVQTVFRTSDDGELTITWAQIFTPRGYKLNRHGVVPTLCTSGLSDDTGSVAALLQQQAAPVPPSLAVSRLDLDEDGWTRLRRRCPPEREKRDIDLEIAHRLLDDPALYRHALSATLQTVAHRTDGEGTP